MDEALIGSGVLTRFAVAGIPFVHVVDAPLEAPPWIVPEWPGSGLESEPIRVIHRLGSATDLTLRLVAECPAPQGDYYLDRVGNVAVRLAPGALSGMRAQLLRTRIPGYEFELVSEQGADIPRLTREWHRTLLMLALPQRRSGLVFHAAGLVLGGTVGVLCPGVSGAGKSTLARLMEPYATVLSDDRVALTTSTRELRVWGTPWHSSANAWSPDVAPCRAIVFVKHGEGATIAPIRPGDAARRLFRTAASPFWDPGGTEFALSAIDRLVTTVPAFEYCYSPSQSAAETLADRLLAP